MIVFLENIGQWYSVGMKKTKTLKMRVRDKHSGQLDQLAGLVNFVWNYVNELSYRSINERGAFLSGFDLHPYTKGAGKALGLHSNSVDSFHAAMAP